MGEAELPALQTWSLEPGEECVMIPMTAVGGRAQSESQEEVVSRAWEVTYPGYFRPLRVCSEFLAYCGPSGLGTDHS